MLSRPSRRGPTNWRWSVFAGVVAGHALVGWQVPTETAVPPPAARSAGQVRLIAAVPAVRPALPPPVPALRLAVPPVLPIAAPGVALAAAPEARQAPRVQAPPVPPDRPVPTPTAAGEPQGGPASPSPQPGAESRLPRQVPRYLTPPAPAYPAASRRLGESGRVLVRVEIDATGRARQVELARSSGFARLDAAALDAVRAARFMPALERGDAVAVWTTVPIVFSIDEA